MWMSRRFIWWWHIVMWWFRWMFPGMFLQGKDYLLAPYFVFENFLSFWSYQFEGDFNCYRTSFSDWLWAPSNPHRIGNINQQTHDCHPMADCINTDFSYQCQCKNGYFEDVGECFDADECVMKTHRKVSKPRSVALLFVQVPGHVISL